LSKSDDITVLLIKFYQVLNGVADIIN